MDLSIILPVYNAELYLKECLDSIVNYMKKNIELIIIDDGSTDNSESIYKKYININKNISIYKNKNHGVSYSRNYGIKKAKGKYITFIDADDYFIDNWMIIIEKKLKSQEDVIYIGNNLSKIKMSKDDIIKNIFKIKKDNNFLSGPWSKLFKKDFLEEHKIRFNEKIINGEDMLFNLSVIKNATKFNIIDESIYNFRVNINSSTHKFNSKFFISNKIFLKELDSLLEEYKYRNIIYSHCLENSILIILNKLSMIKYKDAKKYLKTFDTTPYLNFIMNHKPVNIKDKFIYYNLKRKRYYFTILLIKIRTILKNKKSIEKIINI